MIRSEFKLLLSSFILLASALVATSTEEGLSTFGALEEGFSTKHTSSSPVLPIIPNGVIPEAGWALARLNDAESPETATEYFYPETSGGVRLYLIDSAIDTSSNWFAANPKLTIHPTVLVHDIFETSSGSSYYDHGTRMLSVIAGPENGAAQGTPIEVINYDVYPDGLGGATTPSLLVSAIAEAVLHYETNPAKPSLICIAAGSAITGSDLILEQYVQYAVDSGLPVIVSAGNSGAAAANYIPSAYGTIDGVICVGATNASNTRLSISNFGAPVDIFAPGENVKTLKFPAPASGSFDLKSGTSFSTALATATALVSLSMNPDYTPQELEASLKEGAFAAAESIIQLPPMDSDGDGIHDTIEGFFASDPLDPAVSPEFPALNMGSSNPDGSLNVLLSLSIDESRFDPANPYDLTDGTKWKVLSSTDLINWNPAVGNLVIGAPSGSKRNLTFEATFSGPNAYLNVEITPP